MQNFFGYFEDTCVKQCFTGKWLFPNECSANSSYSVYIAAVVGTISRCSLSIDACCRNQSNKSKLVVCNPLLHLSNCLKQLCSSVIKMGVVCVGVVCVLKHLKDTLKEELAWTTDKRLQVISTITLLKTVIPLRN